MTETKWDKGDRLRITIEADATSKHDYPTIFIKSALDYPMGLNVSGIESAGGTVSVEVLPKLPEGLYEQALVWLAEHDREVKAQERERIIKLLEDTPATRTTWIDDGISVYALDKDDFIAFIKGEEQ